MKLNIYHNKMKCYKCQKYTEVFYPEPRAYKFNYGNIKEVYSRTMGCKTLGNICRHCGAYIGNYFVRDWFLHKGYDDDFEDRLIWVDDEVKCDECGKLIEGYDDIPTGIESFNRLDDCFSCDECKLSFHNKCGACGKRILKKFYKEYPKDVERFQKLEEITFSNTIGHHLQYKPEEKIPVCASCHAKIHHSKDEKYEKFRPKDKRPKEEKKYKLVPCARCKGKAKVLISKFNENQIYVCYKCKNKLMSQREIALDLYNKGIIGQSQLEVTYTEYPEK